MTKLRTTFKEGAPRVSFIPGIGSEGFCPGPQTGWEPVWTDQDGWHFEIWVNLAELEMIAFIEGDLVRSQCPDLWSLRDEVRRICEHVGAAPTPVV